MTTQEKWHKTPWAFRFFRGCVGRLFNIPDELLRGSWELRFDPNGNIYMLLRVEGPEAKPKGEK